jgi:hypothetical protein
VAGGRRDLVFYEQRERQADMPLTVMVGGTLVTGLLVSEREYFSRVGIMFAALSRQASQAADRFWSTWPDAREQPPESNMNPAFLHQADAHVIVGDGVGFSRQAGVLWRCRLDAVDGFFFEQLTRTNDGQNAQQVS